MPRIGFRTTQIISFVKKIYEKFKIVITLSIWYINIIEIVKKLHTHIGKRGYKIAVQRDPILMQKMV